MLSLDVSSLFTLFTNVPIKLVIKGIKDRWSYIEKFTEIPKDEFKSYIVFIMNNMYFQFNNKYYR